MRLTIAATLLANVLLPAASTSQSKNVAPLQQNNNDNIKMKRLQARNQRRLDKAAPATQSSVPLQDPNTFQNRPTMLKNSKKKVECDPEELLLDVGILSCGAGMHCEKNDESPLGGFCDMENSMLASDFSSTSNSKVRTYIVGR
jgi:hypothetical protein